VPEDDTPADLFALLEDEYARAILVETSQRPMSAPALAEACDASRPTIYRRIDRLKDHDLVAETTEPDRDGHHRRTYVARLRSISVNLEDGTFTVSVDRRADPADRFTDMWEGIR
jgi:DNA-binding transcriptional ArsR family regulator